MKIENCKNEIQYSEILGGWFRKPLNEVCLFEQYKQNNPDYKGGPLLLSCPCSKCTPSC